MNTIQIDKTFLNRFNHLLDIIKKKPSFTCYNKLVVALKLS